MLKCDSCGFNTNDDGALVRHQRYQCKSQKATLQDALAAKRKRNADEKQSKKMENEKKRGKRRREDTLNDTGEGSSRQEGLSQVSRSHYVYVTGAR